MIALQDTLFSAKYWFKLGGQETSRHGCINVGSDANINTNKQNQLKITKETLISNFCCSFVRLPVHRFTMKIFALKMLSMKLFVQNMFVWQENDLVFSTEFEKKKH